MIRQHAAGIYSWLPLGLRVLRKIEAIVREEMNKTGAAECLLPAVQPGELWRESGRWNLYGPELLRFHDRHHREFCFGPTHEEIVTDIVRNTISSHRQLPLILYQIQTKFRDEVRPRFGVMRAREFVMKDAYSFHMDAGSLNATYHQIRDAYIRIFERIGLDFRMVEADSGNIGGNVSHEFHVLAASGEDTIAYSEDGRYAANLELASSGPLPRSSQQSRASLQKIATPGVRSIEHVAKQLGLPPEQCVKTLLVRGAEEPLVALVLRGNDELNTIKAAHLPQVASPLEMPDAQEIYRLTGLELGSIGPTDLNLPTIVDKEAAALRDFCCGANVPGYHYTGANWSRDANPTLIADLRTVKEGDPSPLGPSPLRFARGIEVGHIFQLGDKYSMAMGAVVQAADGQPRACQMGCYGIGISRIVAAAIEQRHDERGIVWPAAIAPFQVVIVPVTGKEPTRVTGAAEALYEELWRAGIETVLDDRDLRPGVMFADAELMGIPYRIVVSPRGLDAGTLECRSRSDTDSHDLPATQVLAWLKQALPTPNP